MILLRCLLFMFIIASLQNYQSFKQLFEGAEPRLFFPAVVFRSCILATCVTTHKTNLLFTAHCADNRTVSTVWPANLL